MAGIGIDERQRQVKSSLQHFTFRPRLQPDPSLVNFLLDVIDNLGVLRFSQMPRAAHHFQPVERRNLFSVFSGL